MRDLSLGIDTSNYKTSVAVVDSQGEIKYNKQIFLDVKSGERGLRQSEALFQHIQKVPTVIDEALSDKDLAERIGVVAVSGRPRPVEGSYMPVFTAGMCVGKVLAAGLDVPYEEFSHQQGHVEAVRFYSYLKDVSPVICFHFSGGTTEAVYVDEKEGRFEIVGGTKDLAYGQVLDRVGVAMGLSFPCGEAMDKMALRSKGHRHELTGVKVKDGFVNLSGLETQCQGMVGKRPAEELLDDLFYIVSKSILEMTMQLSYKYDMKNFIYAGGVSCSHYLRNYLVEDLSKDLNLVFGEPEMSADNAVGIALLGGRTIWR